MAEASSIEWTDATWNIVTGCQVVSPGCTNCYAMKLAGTRLQHHPSRAGLTTPSRAGPVWNGKVRFNAEWLTQPLRWKRPRKIFVCAHGDLFADGVEDAWLDQVFAVMALAPQHTFQVLTKRPARMRAYLATMALARWVDALPRGQLPISQNDAERHLGLGRKFSYDPPTPSLPLKNVWLGVSAEDQVRADERIPELLATPASVRWVSAEPLLGPIDMAWALSSNRLHLSSTMLRRGMFSPGLETLRPLHWVVVGGESGPGSRPMHPAWARQIRDDCDAASVPFFFKQWGAWLPGEVFSVGDSGGLVRHQDGTQLNHGGQTDHWWSGDTFAGVISTLVGKKAAGRLLDGVEHNWMPGQGLG